MSEAGWASQSNDEADNDCSIASHRRDRAASGFESRQSWGVRGHRDHGSGRRISIRLARQGQSPGAVAAEGSRDAGAWSQLRELGARAKYGGALPYGRRRHHLHFHRDALSSLSTTGFVSRQHRLSGNRPRARRGTRFVNGFAHRSAIVVVSTPGASRHCGLSE